MEHKHIIASGVVVALIVAGMFTYAFLKKKEIHEAPKIVPVTETTDSRYANITRIDAKHFFIQGTHTVVGEILMPTPCDLLDWKTRTVLTDKNVTMIDFTVVNHAETCAAVVTPQRFKVSFDAAADATIRATFQGRPVELNLIPAGEGETPDDFELFLKG